LPLIDTRTSRVLLTSLAFALGLAFLYVARHTLFAFLFAIFFAYLVDPAVSRVEKLVRGRGRAIGIIYGLMLIGLGIILFFVGPHIGRQAARLGQSLPGLIEKIGSGDIATQIGAEHGWSGRTTELIRKTLSSQKPEILALAQRAGIRIAELAQNIWILVLVPILSVFFLRDGSNFSNVGISLVQARPQREFVQGVLSDLNQMLAHFIRAQITLAVLSLLVYCSFMGLMRVPYGMVLGTAGGFLEFIPVVGPLVAAVLILGVALLSGYPYWIVLLCFLGAWRLVQDYVISPRIMGEKMELHPLAAIFGVLAGGEIGGVLGVYLSIPVMASLRIVFRRWRVYAEKRRFGPLNEYAFGSELSPRK
jgi:predicted PurR-regulated permease PerM